MRLFQNRPSTIAAMNAKTAHAVSACKWAAKHFSAKSLDTAIMRLWFRQLGTSGVAVQA
jgi:hypothetical protein